MNQSIKEMFEIADHNLKCNTAYPVYKELYGTYQCSEDLFENVTDLSFYIHIPFCKQLCRFCEYTRFPAGNEDTERRYIDLLRESILSFLESHPVKKVYGLDIGGGTPSALSEANFASLLQAADALSRFEVVPDFEKSIEITFDTISEAKLQLIHEHGFKRVSAGIQTFDNGLLGEYHRRPSSPETILKIKETIRKAGIHKFNIDLMYGLPGQTDQMLADTLLTIREIMPEQVTLYETRFNRDQLASAAISREIQYRQYTILFEGLSEMGYRGRFGRNTFTVSDDDGVSSYLRHRMKNCMPYKGFGISAQSMTRRGISYGMLKNTALKQMPEIARLEDTCNYLLPPEEIVAKYVSIAMYYGQFSLRVLDGILGHSAEEFYRREFDFLLDRGYITLEEDLVTLTGEGFRYYGAIAALFWSEEQKRELLKNEEFPCN